MGKSVKNLEFKDKTNSSEIAQLSADVKELLKLTQKEEDGAIDKLESLAASGTAIDAKILIESLKDMRI